MSGIFVRKFSKAARDISEELSIAGKYASKQIYGNRIFAIVISCGILNKKGDKMIDKVMKNKIIIGSVAAVCIFLLFFMIMPKKKGSSVGARIIGSSVTAQEIKEWASTIENHAEFDRSAREKFYGKNVKWAGVVGSVSPSAGAKGAYVSLVSPRFVAQFDDKNKVSHLKKGDRIIVKGTISGMSKFGVGGMTTTLKGCSLIK